jgi:hypothetical protein
MLRLIALLLVVVVVYSAAPTRRAVKRFINLTNGLEVLPLLLQEGLSYEDVSFLRIQSTHCEHANHYGILENLDHNFLMHLALGNVCLIYDYGSRGTGALIGEDDHRSGIPRSFWWGLEWIRHSLSSIWHLPEEQQAQRFIRGHNSKALFDEKVDAMPAALRRKLKYYRPYCLTSQLHILPLYCKTAEDGEKQFYFDLVRDLQETATKDDRHAYIPPTVPDDDVPEYVKANLVPPGFHLFTSSDFLNIGRNAPSTLQQKGFLKP